MKKIYTIILTIFLCSCSLIRTIEDIKTIDRNESIDTSSSFYLLYPENGVERSYFTSEATINENSANEVVDVFTKKYALEFGAIKVSEKNINLTQGFEKSKERGDRYLIAMDINEWNDTSYLTCARSENENQKGTLDYVDITIKIYDVKTKKIINNQRIINHGCPAKVVSFIPIGTMGPKGRFYDSLDEWVKGLK